MEDYFGRGFRDGGSEVITSNLTKGKFLSLSHNVFNKVMPCERNGNTFSFDASFHDNFWTRKIIHCLIDNNKDKFKVSFYYVALPSTAWFVIAAIIVLLCILGCVLSVEMPLYMQGIPGVIIAIIIIYMFKRPLKIASQDAANLCNLLLKEIVQQNEMQK